MMEAHLKTNAGNISDTKTRQGNLGSPRASLQVPVRVGRMRSISSIVEAPVNISPPARKRTTSGVFEVEESEPTPKKLSLSPTEDSKPENESETSVTNGKQKTTDTEQNEKKEHKKIGRDKKEQSKEENKSKVVDKFDPEVKSSCVSVFKESDTWD